MGSASKQASAGDKPVLVTWDGEQLWAVLPNVNGDATVAANGYYTGFVTKWQATSLVSGGSYFNPLTFDANCRETVAAHMTLAWTATLSAVVDACRRKLPAYKAAATVMMVKLTGRVGAA